MTHGPLTDAELDRLVNRLTLNTEPDMGTESLAARAITELRERVAELERQLAFTRATWKLPLPAPPPC